MIFAVHQLKEKCREQQTPLNTAFIDLTKAFDLCEQKTAFPTAVEDPHGLLPQLLSIIASFHDGVRGTINFDGAISEPFSILSGLRQGCVMPPTILGILLSLLLSFPYRHCVDGVHLHIRRHGQLFNLTRQKAN